MQPGARARSGLLFRWRERLRSIKKNNIAILSDLILIKKEERKCYPMVIHTAK